MFHNLLEGSRMANARNWKRFIAVAALIWHSWVCIFQSKNQLVASFALCNFAAEFYKFQTCKQTSSCKPPLIPHELYPITLISRRQIADSGLGFPAPSWNSPFISLSLFFIYFWGLNDIERPCSSPLFNQDKIIDVGASSWANATPLPKKTHSDSETHWERTCLFHSTSLYNNHGYWEQAKCFSHSDPYRQVRKLSFVSRSRRALHKK